MEPVRLITEAGGASSGASSELASGREGGEERRGGGLSACVCVCWSETHESPLVPENNREMVWGLLERVRGPQAGKPSSKNSGFKKSDEKHLNVSLKVFVMNSCLLSEGGERAQHLCWCSSSARCRCGRVGFLSQDRCSMQLPSSFRSCRGHNPKLFKADRNGDGKCPESRQSKSTRYAESQVMLLACDC